MEVADKFAFVWGARRSEASGTHLATLLQRAAKVAGHRGLARSMLGVGLRSPWSAIVLLLQPPRWNDSNIALEDELHYVIEGCPRQSLISDLVAFLKEMTWPDWWVTTSDPPPVSHGR